MTDLQRLVAARWQLFVMRDPKVRVALADRAAFTTQEIIHALWPDADDDTGFTRLAALIYPDLAALLASGYTRFQLHEAVFLCLWPDADDAAILRPWRQVRDDCDE